MIKQKFRNNTLFELIHDYLKIYLVKQRNMSAHTIRSYQRTLDQLVDFVKEKKKIPLLDVSFEMLTADMLNAYLDHLETERGCGVSTRNGRLASIRAFLVFAADRDITTAVQLNELKKVPVKKPNKIEVVDHMSMAAISAIAEQPDANTPKGLRDRFFMMLMYDLGARINEMINIKIQDVKPGKETIVELNGKGRKFRSVPLMERTVQHLKIYMEHFHPEPRNNASYLFYTISHGQKNPMSASCIRLFISQYSKAAREVCGEVPENVYPHLWRHSRAMHLYQEGMDLTLVSQWLGHAHLQTTKIYAHADTEHKRKAIVAATTPDNPLYSKLNSARYVPSDEETLKRLIGLR
jgi:site-specific recombinase XerD